MSTPPTAGPSARTVTTAVFFAFAVALGLWAGAIPVLTARAGLDAAGLGLALMLNSGAYIGAMALGGPLARVVPARRLMVLALAAQAAAAAAVFTAGTGPGLTLAIAALGAASGLLDLAMNTEGTAVERELGRPVLTRMHAAASGAFALGALAGSVLAVRAGPLWCLAPVLAVNLPVAFAAWRLAPRAPAEVPARLQPSTAVPAEMQPALAMPAGTQPSLAEPAGTQSSLAEPAPGAVTAPPAGWRPVAVLGTVLGITIAAEVTAQMWSARFLQQQSAQLAALAGAGAALFSGCQSMLRLMGDALRQRVGDGRLITVSLLVAALGFATVAAAGVPWPWLSALHGFGPAVAGFALVGLGTACVVPCLFALIARQAPDRAAAALGTASLVAGLIRLPAPLLLGWVVSLWSDAAGFAGMALALLLGALLARRGMARGGPSGMAGAAAPVRHAAGYSAGP